MVAEPALKFIYIQLDKNYKLFRIPSRIPIGICLTAFFSFNLTGAGKIIVSNFAEVIQGYGISAPKNLILKFL